MSIIGVTSLRGLLVSSLLQTTISRLRATGSRSTAKSSPGSSTVAGSLTFDPVISRAQELVKEHPEVGLPHNILGRALQKAGRLSEAIVELNIAAKAAPGNLGYVRDLAGAYVARARVKLDTGDMVSAEADLQSTRSIDPANSDLPEVSARVAAHHAGRDIASGRYVAALSKLSVAASDAPDDAQFKKSVAALYARVAVHFHNQGDDAQALSSYSRAYELDPTSPAVRRNVGQLSHERGLNALDRKDYDIAIEHLDRGYQAVRANDTYREDLAGAYDLRGQYWVSRGELDKAIEDFKTGYRLDPSNASLSANLSSAVKQSLAT